MRWSTALFPVVAFFLTQQIYAGDGASKQTVRYLHSLQTESGGFLAATPSKESVAKPSLRATLSAVRAVRYLGAELENAEGIRDFVRRCYDAKTGAFADSPGGDADVLASAIGLMAVVDLKLPVEKFQGAVRYLEKNATTFDDIRISAAAFESLGKPPGTEALWLKKIRNLENADGTFGKGDGQARDTGGAGAAILRLGAKVDRDSVLGAMKKGQRKSGGFGKDSSDADLETTYWVMRLFMMLKSRPDDVSALRGFIAKCRNGDGGYGISPGMPSSASGTYFAAIITHWLR